MSQATTLEQALHDHLKKDTVIQGKVGDKVYLGRVPQAGEKPIPSRCIVINDFSRSPDYHTGGEIGLTTTTVQVDVWARDPDATELLNDSEGSIGEAVRQQLSGFRGDVGTVSIKSSTTQRDNLTASRPDDGSDNWLRRRSFDFRIIHSMPTVSATVY